MAGKKEAAVFFSEAEEHLKVGRPQPCVEAAEKALEIFRGLGSDYQGATADALRLVVEGKRQVCAQLKKDLADVKSLAESERNNFKQAGDRRGEASMMILVGEIELDMRKRGGQFPSIPSLETALQMCREVGDRRLEGSALLTMSNVYLARPALVEAKAAADESLSLFEGLGDRVQTALAIRNAGRSQLAGGKFEAGQALSQKAVEIFREEGARKLEADELISRSSYLLRGGRTKSALMVGEQGLSLLKIIGCEKPEEAEALQKICGCLLALKKGQTAALRALEAAKRFQAEGCPEAQAMALQVVVHAQLQLGKRNEALKAAQDATLALHDSEDLCLKAQAMQEEASAMASLNDSEEASRRFYDASTQAGKANNSALQAEIIRACAQMHMDTGNYKDALSQAREAVDLSERFGDKHSMAVALDTVGTALGIQGNLEQAVKSAQESQELFQETGDPMGEEKALELLGKLRAAQGKLQEALEAVEERLSVVRELGDMAKEADALHQLAGLHFQSGNIASAERTIKEAKGVAKKVGAVGTEGEILVTLAHIYLQKADAGGEPAGEDGEFRPNLELAGRVGADAASLAGKAKNKRLRAQALVLRGRAMLRMSRNTEAWRAGAEASNTYQELGDGQGMARALLLCGEIQIENGERESAKDIIEQAMDIAQQCSEQDLVAQAEGLLAALKPKVAAALPVQQVADVQVAAVAQGAAPAASAAPAVVEKKGLDPVFVRKQVLAFVKDAIADDEEIEIDSPFMEAGMDSLSSVSLTSMLAKEFGMALSPSLVFDFPTVRALEAHLVEESMG
eukprot:TRINITY_DN57489_c0_g1_i1.p1 TRINITY_DN57489_c0_g1~~TRINITY_DN57489_c0_g1_i1.p1  ORF type:complete len:802 (+),score=257.16 TRINITY_DN57489_c0_g1_i1:72-2477(+)